MVSRLNGESASSIRSLSFEVSLPTCLIDVHGLITDWNPAFDELIAKPLRISRGSHARSVGISLPERVSSKGTTASTDVVQAFQSIVSLGRDTSYERDSGCLVAELIDHDGVVRGWSAQLLPDIAGDESSDWHRMVNRIENELTWSKYAVVYDELLLRFPEYRSLMRQVSLEVSGAKRCADLGAGTGNSTIQLLADDATRSVHAVESNAFMLRRFLGKAGDQFSGRLEVLHGDVEAMPFFQDEIFDAVTIVNALYALDRPESCLEEVYRILRTDGRLVLTTPHAETDVDRLLARLRESLIEQRVFDDSEDAFRTACERHHALSQQIHQFTIDKIIDLIETCGFRVNSCVPAYVDAVVLINAERP